MKKYYSFLSLSLLLVILFAFSGCISKNVNISKFEEIEYNLVSDTLDKYTKRIENASVGYIVEGYTGGLYLYGNQNVDFQYSHLEGDYPDYAFYQIDDASSEIEPTVNYTREDGVDIRDVEGMHSELEEQYILFEEFCSDNPDCIQMEMQDDRGYIIFDIDDSEIISALSGENEVSEGTRYYGVRYHCDRCYITATYMSDSNDDFRDFVSLLDELGLPHM